MSAMKKGIHTTLDDIIQCFKREPQFKTIEMNVVRSILPLVRSILAGGYTAYGFTTLDERSRVFDRDTGVIKTAFQGLTRYYNVKAIFDVEYECEIL